MPTNISGKISSESLVEHLNYERSMLRYAFQRLHDSDPDKAWNMAYECFSIHARNTYDFLRNAGKKSNTFRADSIAKNWKKPKAYTKFNVTDGFVFHMSSIRSTKQKLTLRDLQDFGLWLDREWQIFLKSAPEEIRNHLDQEPACPPGIKLKEGVTEATACTNPTSITWDSVALDIDLNG